MKFSNIFEFSNSNSLFLENIQVPSLFDKQTTLNNSFSTVNNFFGNNPFFDKILNIDFFENLTFNSLLLDTFIVFNNILNNQFFYETFFSTFNNVHFFSLNNVNDLTFLFLSDDSDFYLKSLNIYIDKIDDISLFQNLENITSTYHYSIPNVKLAYPEPFIASPSFIHSDLWFTHITVFQYWLWFVFIFIIVFFFLTFLCTIRWCNMRIRPRRETRGVSRSKCGDLITATVPVAWATSIIINESTDAVDYYDGFGTTELVVGIRAYQWGWEYYYPKDIDLNYNIKPAYSAFIGNSLKYNKSSDTNLNVNNLWKYYQNKSNDQVITPAHMLVIPSDNYKLLNFYNFNDLGSSPVQEINAFKKIRMFSKTYTSNLNFIPNNFSSKYKLFSNLYNNDLSFSDSYLYGVKRQHNFLSSSSLLNNQSSFLNLKSINKISNFNFKNSIFNNNLNDSISYNYYKKSSNSNLLSDSSRIYSFFKQLSNSNEYRLNKFLFYSNFISSINVSTKNKLVYPIYKIFNSKLDNFVEFNNFNNLNTLNTLNDLSLVDSNNEVRNYFFNKNFNYKMSNTFSSNNFLLTSERFVRKFVNNSSSSTNNNYSLKSNTLNEYFINSNSNFGLNNLNLLNLSNNEWINPNSSSKYLNSRLSVDYPYSPILSNNPSINLFNYDSLKNSPNPTSPRLFQSEGDMSSSPLFGIYWNFYWSNSNVEWRLQNNFNYNLISKSFYLPMFTFYYDYDFRNWQALEMLEDAYWESNYSIYNHDEYLSLAKDYYDYSSYDKFSNFYNKFNRSNFASNKSLFNPFFKDTLVNDSYATSFYLDDFLSPVNLLKSKDFHIFHIFNLFNDIEESYESLKFLNHFYNLNNKFFLNLNNSYFQPYSYLFVFDAFRSDYTGFSWFLDENNFNLNKLPFSLLEKFNFEDLDYSIFNSDYNFNLNKTLRFNNNLNLRNTVKNSMVTYNSIQKVLKTRFDEGRSNTKLADFANFYIKQPFISSPRVQYEKLLGKTKENFFKINFYKNSFQNYFNNFYDANSSLNYYFFDFPFLLAMKSDSSRYFWFDWFAKWGVCEVQPSSSSRYAIYGMPYFSKNFEFNLDDNDSLNESETYLLRLSRARRSYLPNWVYTPYFYSRNSSWYKNNIIFDVLEQNENKLISTMNLLNLMNWYWKDLYLVNYHSYLFTPSNSGNSSYMKLNWKPQNSIQSYYYNVSALIDILTKREYLYREFLSNNNKIINLPFYLTSNPSNPLINEIKASFLFSDPIIYNNEYSRDVYYNSLNFFNYTILKSYLFNYSNFLNLNFITDYLFYYFFNNNFSNSLQSNSELYKNQYRPMRKGISNMIRLHATGAIALPIEMRVQILASSKDVIHSWAIPSAGIKIDCVPGYSSHKVMIFLVSGIFWGQCMEICGRYHHWMPIIVYFMKRDLFFLWCTHFVFLNSSNSTWGINDRFYTDYTKTVSFDKYSWLSELNN
jgi:heme/copper-type cytochrome/quinol oxidase subunit 2